jgi:SHS2 domain-containing protein
MTSGTEFEQSAKLPLKTESRLALERPRPPRAPDALSPSHQIADHVSEIRLRVLAGSLAELLEEAGEALAQVELRGADATPGGWRKFELSARDRANLLVEWLNQLIDLAKAERWVGSDFEVDEAENGRVRARVWGVQVQRAPARLKAASLLGSRVEDVPGGVKAEVLLDV